MKKKDVIEYILLGLLGLIFPFGISFFDLEYGECMCLVFLGFMLLGVWKFCTLLFSTPELSFMEKFKQTKYLSIASMVYLPISIIFAIIFAIINYLWWPKHQAQMDRKIARLVDYDLVWYAPDRIEMNLMIAFLIVAVIVLLSLFIRGIYLQKRIKDIASYGLGVCIVVFFIYIFASNLENKVSAVYFSEDQIVEVYDWKEDQYEIFPKSSLSYEYEERVSHGKYVTYYKSYTIHDDNNNWFRIDFETDENFQLKRIPFYEIKNDREVIIKEIEKLKPY